MKLVSFYHKTISMFVMVTFTILLCFWANQAPAAPAAEKNSGTTMEQGDNNSPSFIEEESESESKVKHKKFPWLLVGAAVVVGAAVLYFLILKTTKYELTITLGAGTTGTPATGKYKKGEVVPYSYSAQTGYVNLQVMLDGAEVAAAGSVTMDKAHTITIRAVQGATIQVNSTPAGGKIYLDNVDSNFTTPHSFNFTTAVTKSVLVIGSCGYKEFSQIVHAYLGQSITVNATLAAGIKEDFNMPASSCWSPYHSTSWSTVGGIYKFSGARAEWSTNVYNHSFSRDYSITVKMNRKAGPAYANAIFLGTSTNMTSASGYVFLYYTSGKNYGVIRYNSFNFINDSGSYKWIKYATSNAIVSGPNKWNTLKIVKAGSHYTYYINNVVMHSFNDATYNPSYCALLIGCNFATEMLYDYVYLDAGSTTGSVPGQPVKSMPVTDKENLLYSPLTGVKKD